MRYLVDDGAGEWKVDTGSGGKAASLIQSRSGLNYYKKERQCQSDRQVKSSTGKRTGTRTRLCPSLFFFFSCEEVGQELNWREREREREIVWNHAVSH